MSPAESNSAFAAASRLHRWVRQGKSFSGSERNACFLNLGEGRFADISGSSGFDVPDDARAIGLTDWDQDGDWDLWTANRNGPQLRFFQNRSDPVKTSVMLSLVGEKCNRDAIGARVVGIYRDASGNHREPVRLIRTVRAGDGYLSQSSKLVHFGLGDTVATLRVVVQWPSDDEQDFGTLKPGRYQLTQGVSKPRLLVPATKPITESNSVASAPGFTGLPARDTGRTVLASRIPIPDLTFVPSQQSAQQIALTKGKPTLVHLWATWCTPCLPELTELIQHADKLRRANLQIILLSIPNQGNDASSQPDNVLSDLRNPFDHGQATPTTLDVLQAVHNHVFDRHRPLPVPTSFLFDGAGELAVIYKGPVTSAQVVGDASRLEEAVADRRLASVPFVGHWVGPRGELVLAPLAVALAESGHLDLATEYVQRHRDRFPRKTLAQLLARQGNVLYEEGALLRAVTVYQEALAVDPTFAPAHLNLAVARMKDGDWKAAEKELALAIEHDPGYAQAHYQLGMLLLRKGLANQALSHLSRAVEHEPRVSKYRLTLANVLLSGRELDGAVSELRTALQFDPSNTAAWGMLGTAYLQSGKDRQAAECFERIVELQPDFPPALGDLARILATTSDTELRDVAKAIRLAERACQLEDHKNARRLMILAQAYQAAERRSDAQDTLKTALSLAEQDQNRDLARKIRQLLE